MIEIYIKMRKSIILILIFGVIMSCKKDEETNNSNDFNVAALLTDVTNNNILVAVNNFNREAETLHAAVETYLANINEDDLVQLRTQWRTAALSYARTYAFNIGEVRSRFFQQALYNWPTLPNAIENFIINNDEINAELVATFSPQVKTLSALEYFLFRDDVVTTNQMFETSENRRNYLMFTAVELRERANMLLDVWQASGENYANTFVNSDETGIDNSFNLLYNGLFNLIDTGKVTKVGKPAGLENSQNTNPELAQAYFSESSLDILRANIESVEAVYFASEGVDISDYVFLIIRNDELNTAIQTKINEIYAAIDAIPVSLFEAITTNPNEVGVLHEKLEELGILFSVDVRSVLSIIITSTDNDGD